MEFIEQLSRNEMRTIIGGNDCAVGCLGLYGGYYEECDETYPSGTDGRMACFTEVRDLNRLCLNDCFN